MFIRQLLRFFLSLIGILAIVGLLLQFGTKITAGYPSDKQFFVVVGGISLFLALFLLLMRLLLDAMGLQGGGRPKHDPLRIGMEIAEATIGVIDEVDLAAATGRVIEAALELRWSGWLFCAAQGARFIIQPLSGPDGMTVKSTTMLRSNPLLEQLDARHAPLLHTAIRMDGKSGPMDSTESEWLKELGAAVYVPIYDSGVLTAVIVTGPKKSGRQFQAMDIDALRVVAAQMTAVLKTMRAIANLRKLNADAEVLNQSLRETNQAMEHMSAARTDFLMIASHELRTPLTQLLGFAELLNSMSTDKDLDPAMVADLTGSISKACSRLNEVITQIMDMAQLDVDAMELNYQEKVLLDDVLRQAVEPYAPALRERRLTLKVAGIKGLPPFQADEARLVQSFGQLLSNAIKFTPDGGRIEISARLITAEGIRPPRLEVIFADTGIGLDPSQQELIFQKFYRVGRAAQHSTGKTKFMGAGPGLGLSIARGVIERHGGRVWAESSGHDPVKFPGSRFHVELPLKPPALSASRAVAGAPPTGGKKDRKSAPLQNPFTDA